MSYKDYRGCIKSVSLRIKQYAQRRRCRFSVLVLYSMKVHSVCVRSKSNTYPLHLHLGVAERANTFSVPKWRERAINEKEPLKLEMAPVNQRTIGEMELVPSAVGPSEIEQRCKKVKVRTLRGRVESRGGEGPPSSSSGAG